MAVQIDPSQYKQHDIPSTNVVIISWETTNRRGPSWAAKQEN
jgi:hypothetical protein